MVLKNNFQKSSKTLHICSQKKKKKKKKKPLISTPKHNPNKKKTKTKNKKQKIFHSHSGARTRVWWFQLPGNYFPRSSYLKSKSKSKSKSFHSILQIIRKFTFLLSNLCELRDTKYCSTAVGYFFHFFFSNSTKTPLCHKDLRYHTYSKLKFLHGRDDDELQKLSLFITVKFGV